jgi:hypothetical protein
MTTSTGPDWGEQLRRMMDGVRGLLAEPARAAEGVAGGVGHGSECRYCPLCQAIAVVRGERPEVSAALADLLASTATALRAFSESHEAGPTWADATPPDATGEPPPDVQQIEIA